MPGSSTPRSTNGSAGCPRMSRKTQGFAGGSTLLLWHLRHDAGWRGVSAVGQPRVVYNCTSPSLPFCFLLNLTRVKFGRACQPARPRAGRSSRKSPTGGLLIAPHPPAGAFRTSQAVARPCHGAALWPNSLAPRLAAPGNQFGRLSTGQSPDRTSVTPHSPPLPAPTKRRVISTIWPFSYGIPEIWNSCVNLGAGIGLYCRLYPCLHLHPA